MHPGSIPGEASSVVPPADGERAACEAIVGPLHLGMSRGEGMNPDFHEQRVRMVDSQLRTTDVFDPALLDAMMELPREEFVPGARASLAYVDEDLEIVPAHDGRSARYLMEPSPFARLVQLAQVRPTDFVLDVGCGTGYSAAVQSRLASSVVALECDPALAERAGETLSRLGYDNVAVVQGPLERGYPSEAPYDVIFVGGAVDEVPAALFSQLRDGGRLVAVEGHGNAGWAVVHLNEQGVISSLRVFNAAVKPLPGFARTPAFEF